MADILPFDLDRIEVLRGPQGALFGSGSLGGAVRYLLAKPDLKAFVDKHYVVVTVDVGRYTKNMQIPARYGLDKLQGVPSFLVVDTKGKKIDLAELSGTKKAESEDAGDSPAVAEKAEKKPSKKAKKAAAPVAAAGFGYR